MSELETVEQRTQKLVAINGIFTPAAPITTKELFSGRVDQLRTVLTGVSEPGRHIVVYGERGVGKTSLANIVSEILADRGHTVAKVTADTTDNFESLWRKLLQRVRISLPRNRAGFAGAVEETLVSLDELLPRNVKPADILRLFEKQESTLVLITDEYDRICESTTKGLTADTLKMLSDNKPDVTVILIGVARNIGDLVGHHESIQRNLKQVEMPRMSETEMGEIIEKGLKRLEMKMEGEPKKQIMKFAAGFPHYIHLLANQSCRHAIERGSTTVSREDFDFAVSEALDNASESIRQAYQRATIATKPTLYEPLLLACAEVKKDEHGTFRPTDLEPHVSRIVGRQVGVGSLMYPLAKLCSAERGNILEKVGRARHYRYRFSDPLMEAYIRLKAHSATTLRSSATAESR